MTLLKGIWVGYNRSCHAWLWLLYLYAYMEGTGVFTAGCTAMFCRRYAAIVHWLDPVANPMLVQRIRGAY